MRCVFFEPKGAHGGEPPRAGGEEGAVPRPCRGWATGRRALRGYEGRTETPPQNSQRVLLAKPRTAAVSHRGR